MLSTKHALKRVSVYLLRGNVEKRACGEEVLVTVDISAGSHQDCVEDCPVYCHLMRLHVEIAPDGEAHIDGEHE